MSRAFLDTNILLYTADERDAGRRAASRRLIEDLCKDGLKPFISTQVLQEFYVGATQKFAIDPVKAKGMMRGMLEWDVVVITPELINNAIDCSILNRISFWDGLIVAAAEAARCEVLYTEDLNHGQVIRGVRVQNPFQDN